jgi:hypothetical protein
MIIFNAITHQQLCSFLARLPPGRDVAPRRLAAKVCQQPETFVEHVALLGNRHVGGVFVAVAVETDFVTSVSDHGAFFGEGLEAVAGDEPGCFDVVFFEELEEAPGAYCAGE